MAHTTRAKSGSPGAWRAHGGLPYALWRCVRRLYAAAPSRPRLSSPRVLGSGLAMLWRGSPALLDNDVKIGVAGCASAIRSQPMTSRALMSREVMFANSPGAHVG